MITRNDTNAPENAKQSQGLRILSFDVEEYFQVEAAANCVDRSDWECWEKRLPGCVDRILAMLGECRASATFFVLGWVAEHEPQIVRRIARCGHEIASHGMTHTMIHRLTPDEFRRDAVDTRHMLEDLTGLPVVGYRAPTFSLTHETPWAIDVLVEAGYEYDSSVFPIHHDRYGVPDAPPQPHFAVSSNGTRILEIPPLTVRAMGVNLPVGGGGYFRLLPRWVIARAIRSARKHGRCAMIYLHPWEFDPDQPLLDMPFSARWRHRVNLHHTGDKLRGLLKRFRFHTVAECIDLLRARTSLTHHYGKDVAPSRAPSRFREKSNAPGVL
jgi:polysaccharide deacetylase family protein (PEP-CTERM system associated)